MAGLPKHVTRLDTGDGVRYQVCVHGSRPDGSRFHYKRKLKTPAEAMAWTFEDHDGTR